ncbi:hypothetical protein HY993_00270 [Candidatus Micrarchaeota archaeon]|nr:hypothetical protein [Candidatus Micrarchaeota archaeon]
MALSVMASVAKKALREYAASTVRGERITISVFDDGISLKQGARETPIKFNYITSLSKGSDLPLSKTGAKLAYYDMMGSQETIEFIINSTAYPALKADLRK